MFQNGIIIRLNVFSLVLDKETCLDFRNVKEGAGEMNEEGKVVVGMVLIFGLHITLFGRVRKISQIDY